jgi:hypothetical protein
MQEILTKLVPQTLIGVERYAEDSWTFSFSNGCSINIMCPWRLIDGGTITNSGADDGQLFGLSEPVDSDSLVKVRLRGRPVTSVEIRKPGSDLLLNFNDNGKLEGFTNSSGYESWSINMPASQVIACGGGESAVIRAEK